MDVGNLLSGSSVFSKSSLNTWKFSVHVLLKPSLKDFEHYFASLRNECNLWQFDHSFTLSFFRIGMKTDIFQACGHCWVFQICWHIECSTFTASSFRIWNSSIGIPSPPLVVILPKAHLTSYPRMSASRWVTTQFYFLLVSGYSFWDCGSRACHPPWKTSKGSRLSWL